MEVGKAESRSHEVDGTIGSCQRHRAGPSEPPSKLLLFAKSHSPSTARWGETGRNNHFIAHSITFFSSVKVSNHFLSLCKLSAPIICYGSEF